MQNNIKVWIESSTLSFDLNSHDEGVYLISDLDGLTSLPSIRTSAGVNAGTDGGWTSAQAFDARLISLSVVIANEDVSIVESKRRLLNSLLAQSRKETLKLHFTTEAGMEFIINVRITAVTGALTNILKKQELLIQMRADDPIIYGAQGGEGADATLLVQQTQSGFEIPFDIPLLIGGGSDKVDVEDLGTEEVYPIIKMTGPLHNPTVVNETQNAEIGINADLGDMEWRGYQSAELLGNTTQTTLSGKNLINLANAGTTSNGITTTFSNNTAHIANTSTSSWANITAVQTGVSFLAGNYTFSIDHTLAYAIRFRATYTDSTSEDFSISAGAKSVSFTTTKEINRFYMFIEGFSVGATLNETISIMLENGSTATSYEPYCGGIPSPNPDYPQTVNTVTGLQTVKFVGNNILDIKPSDVRATSAGLTLTRGDDGSISYSGSPSQTYAFITTEVNAVYEPGNYTFSIGDDINADANIYLRFKMLDGTETIVQVDKNTGTNSNIIFTQPTVSYVLAFRGMAVNVQIAGTVKPQFKVADNEFDPSVLPATWTNTTAVFKTLNLKPNTSYALTSDIPRASGNALLFFLEAGQSIATNTNGVWDGQSRTLMTDSTGSNLQIAYRSYSGETRMRDDYRYLLTSSSAYEPYIETNYGINLGGQNLFDQSLMGNDENKGITLSSTRDTVTAIGTTDSTYYPAWVVFGDGTLTKTNWWPTASTVDITKGQFCDSTPHTLSIEVSGATVVANTIAYFVGYTDGTYSGNLFIGAGATSAKVTTNKAINFIAIGFKGGNVPINNTFKIQLVEGDKALPFASYTDYQYELCKIGTYQDSIYKSGDKWYKHAEINKIVLDGTENWGTIWGNTAGLWTSNVSIGAEVVQGNDVGFSDHFMYKWSYNSNTPCFYVYNQSGQGRIMVIQSFTSDLNTYKTWLTNNLPSVYYILATPTDTEITDSDLIGQLEALLNYAPWYGDDQNVFLIPSAGAQGELILGAHNEPKPADEVLIDTHLKTVTLNGQNAYPLLKDGSSFFSLAPGDNIMYLTSDVSSDTGKAEIKFKQGFISI